VVAKKAGICRNPVITRKKVLDFGGLCLICKHRDHCDRSLHKQPILIDAKEEPKWFGIPTIVGSGKRIPEIVEELPLWSFGNLPDLFSIGNKDEKVTLSISEYPDIGDINLPFKFHERMKINSSYKGFATTLEDQIISGQISKVPGYVSLTQEIKDIQKIILDSYEGLIQSAIDCPISLHKGEDPVTRVSSVEYRSEAFLTAWGEFSSLDTMLMVTLGSSAQKPVGRMVFYLQRQIYYYAVVKLIPKLYQKYFGRSYHGTTIRRIYDRLIDYDYRLRDLYNRISTDVSIGNILAPEALKQMLVQVALPVSTVITMDDVLLDSGAELAIRTMKQSWLNGLKAGPIRARICQNLLDAWEDKHAKKPVKVPAYLGPDMGTKKHLQLDASWDKFLGVLGKDCPRCHGSGIIDNLHPCPSCEGGECYPIREHPGLANHLAITGICEDCCGDGSLDGIHPCPSCEGNGGS